MFQNFDVTTDPKTGKPRLALLRKAMTEQGVQGFLVPRADAYQGEYVAPSDARLAWLTGFTGSAGFACVLPDIAGVFVDGRYTVQVRQQVDPEQFTPVNWPANQLGPWLVAHLPEGGIVGFDPWLHTEAELEKLRPLCDDAGITLTPMDNLIDAIWLDQPDPPMGKIAVHPLEFAGLSSAEKIAALAAEMTEDTALITLPDSIAWLLNIRGSDIVRNPVPHAYALLHKTGQVELFCAEQKLDDAVRAHLGPQVTLHPPQSLPNAMSELTGTLRMDKATTPVWFRQQVSARIVWGADPCVLPKACKNPSEIKGMRSAHLRDAVAMVRFLHWLDQHAPTGGVTEISAAQQLETFRRADNGLRDISFETISGAGPNAALPHYHVSTDSDRVIPADSLYLVDSGGQYLDGTTDITRTVAVGNVDATRRACYTAVLQGMIALSRARFPKGLTGRDLDPLARAALWSQGRDYDHGTGHGVGAYLCVHEGPARISRVSEIALQPGMILSNEPGYYREGAFGIRIENLIVVQNAPALLDGDAREMLDFETLTWVPIDTRPLDLDALSPAERRWLDAYHAQVRALLSPRLDGAVLDWLISATQPLPPASPAGSV